MDRMPTGITKSPARAAGLFFFCMKCGLFGLSRPENDPPGMNTVVRHRGVRCFLNNHLCGIRTASTPLFNKKIIFYEMHKISAQKKRFE